MTLSPSTSSAGGVRLPRVGRTLAALALALAASAAAPAFATSITLSPTGGGTYAGSFVQMASGLVIDDFSVAPMTFASTYTVALASVTGPVSFLNTVFYPDTNAEILFPVPDGAAPGSPFSFSAPVAAGQTATFRVFGLVTDAMGIPNGGDGSYRVTVTSVAAVPEAQTWALLLAGLGSVGWVARRRRG